MPTQTLASQSQLELNHMAHLFIFFSCSFDHVVKNFTYTMLFDALYGIAKIRTNADEMPVRCATT
jgi:hypothetical protein